MDGVSWEVSDGGQGGELNLKRWLSGSMRCSDWPDRVPPCEGRVLDCAGLNAPKRYASYTLDLLLNSP